MTIPTIKCGEHHSCFPADAPGFRPSSCVEGRWDHLECYFLFSLLLLLKTTEDHRLFRSPAHPQHNHHDSNSKLPNVFYTSDAIHPSLLWCCKSAIFHSPLMSGIVLSFFKIKAITPNLKKLAHIPIFTIITFPTNIFYNQNLKKKKKSSHLNTKLPPWRPQFWFPHQHWNCSHKISQRSPCCSWRRVTLHPYNTDQHHRPSSNTHRVQIISI